MTHTNAVEMDSIKTKAAEAVAKAKEDHEKKVRQSNAIVCSASGVKYIAARGHDFRGRFGVGASPGAVGENVTGTQAVCCVYLRTPPANLQMPRRWYTAYDPRKILDTCPYGIACPPRAATHNLRHLHCALCLIGSSADGAH